MQTSGLSKPILRGGSSSRPGTHLHRTCSALQAASLRHERSIGPEARSSIKSSGARPLLYRSPRFSKKTLTRRREMRSSSLPFLR